MNRVRVPSGPQEIKSTKVLPQKSLRSRRHSKEVWVRRACKAIRCVEGGVRLSTELYGPSFVGPVREKSPLFSGLERNSEPAPLSR